MIAFSLPYPPSANKLWRSVNGRNIASAQYRTWQGFAAAAIPPACRGQVQGRFGITILFDRPDRRARDLDNLLKPTLDALKPNKAYPALKGVIRDDSDAGPILIDWSGDEPVKNPRVHITIQPLTAGS